LSPATGSPDFVILQAGCGIVPTGGSCTLTVSFRPGSVGAKSATLSTGASGPTAMLTGEGITGTITVTPAAETFGNALVGAQTAARTFTVRNGTAAAFTASPVVSPEFLLVGHTCGPLQPGQTCTVDVAYKPASASAKSGMLTTGAGGPTATLNGSGWTSQDIGSVGKTGSVTLANDTFTVKGAGADIYKTADAFKYVFQSVTGDATITARVASVQAADAWTKAGVMMRVGTTADAVNVFALCTPSTNNGYRTQVRASQGGSTSSLTGPLGAAPVWLRLVRTGSTFKTFTSPNGTTWTPINTSTVTMPATINVGLAVNSHVASTPTLAAGVFDSVTVTLP
jgi:hypothetical protein